MTETVTCDKSRPLLGGWEIQQGCDQQLDAGQVARLVLEEGRLKAAQEAQPDVVHKLDTSCAATRLLKANNGQSSFFPSRQKQHHIDHC